MLFRSHGVGVSVVNALSSKLEVWVKRNGTRYHMGFKDGKRVTKLEEQGDVGKANTGTLLRFWPDPKYFDSPKFSIPKLKHVMRAKAVLCPGLTVKFINEQTLEKEEWHYVGGLKDYLIESLEGADFLPDEPFTGSMKGEKETVDWAVLWLPEGGEVFAESYVNLIPTVQGGTHVNGLRTGITDRKSVV